MLSPEPILDVVRGLSTVASFGIVINQMWSLMDEIFTSDCEYCRGTGRIICRHCHGTKTLRKRPGEFHYQHMAVVDRSARDLYPCIYCGPNTRYDFERVGEDNEDEAYNIMDNLKAAVANKRRPFPSPILAGTIPCPECGGSPLMRRHTPNWARLTQTEHSFDYLAGMRIANVSRSGKTSSIRPRKYLENPSQMPRNMEADPATLAKLYGERAARLGKKDKKKKKEGPSMRASDQLTADDYLTPYIDDDDSDVED